MNLDVNILRPEQVRVLRIVGVPLAEAGFYLGGGTAVARHLGHRRSNGLDWFSREDPAAPDQWVRRLRALGLTIEVVSFGPGTLHVRADGVSVTCLRYPYPLPEELLVERSSGARVAGQRDLVARKLVALTQRGSRKDFVDILALLDRGWTLSEMLDSYGQKYDVEDVAAVLTALTYSDEADAEPMPQMLTPWTWPSSRPDSGPSSGRRRGYRQAEKGVRKRHKRADQRPVCFRGAPGGQHRCIPITSSTMLRAVDDIGHPRPDRSGHVAARPRTSARKFANGPRAGQHQGLPGAIQ